MLSELQDRYNTLEEARLALIHKVRGLKPERLNHKTGPDRWSILEDFQHLVLAEQRTSFKAGSVLDSEERKAGKFEMVLQVLDHDTVVDVPDPGMIPDGNATLESLITGWEKSRMDLFKFLESCGPEDLERPVSRHPVTGSITVVECLRLIDSHFNHHRRRIEAAIEQI
ncbi:MAG: DinB family protein [Desulfobacteraceae bacterium]|nr:DinB family protein [Desulfobacteraceae bacterium]MBC2751451.1 DinB family protein [Desulfobacteraceae bacterium]